MKAGRLLTSAVGVLTVEKARLLNESRTAESKLLSLIGDSETRLRNNTKRLRILFCWRDLVRRRKEVCLKLVQRRKTRVCAPAFQRWHERHQGCKALDTGLQDARLLARLFQEWKFRTVSFNMPDFSPVYSRNGSFGRYLPGPSISAVQISNGICIVIDIKP